jgi:sporulation protein YlmC with PRC-barrel domain
MTSKVLLGAASALALMGGVALAQTSPSTGTTGQTPTAPQVQAPSPGTGGTGTGSTMSQTPSTGTTATTPSGSSSSMAATQPSGEPVAASHLMGHDVLGADGEEVGTVTDLVIDTASGQIQQVVIKSGGVLGVGGKSVALDFSEIEMAPNQGIKTSLTEATFESMPEWDDDTTVSLDAETTPATGAGGTAVTPGTPAAPDAAAPMPGATPAPRQ